MLTTEGHRDVLVVGRGNRMAMYNIKAPPDRPLVPRSHCFEVRERMRVDGAVSIPLDEAGVAAIGRRLAEERIEAVAICFLHSYANPEHERRAARNPVALPARGRRSRRRPRYCRNIVSTSVSRPPRSTPMWRRACAAI